MDGKLIYTKIPAIMADIDPIKKEQRNKTQGFMYRGIDDLYNALQKIMSHHKVCSVPYFVEVISRTERPTKSGGVLFVSVYLIDYNFYAEDGSSITARVVGEAMDSGDKGSNKAFAVADKYALLQVFKIPTEDSIDPDSESHEVVSSPQPQEKKFSDEPGVQPVLDNIKKAIEALTSESMQTTFHDDAGRLYHGRDLDGMKKLLKRIEAVGNTPLSMADQIKQESKERAKKAAEEKEKEPVQPYIF